MTTGLDRAPACSIVLPTFDRAHLLGEAIGSVLAQTRPDWELLVVDDGSTDGTRSLVDGIGDPRVRRVEQPHRGVSAARNRGLELARSDLVCFLDSDDRLLPRALELHLGRLAAEPSVGMTVAGAELIDASGRLVGVRAPWAESGALDCRGWLFNCSGMPGTVAIRRAWLARAGGFRTEREPVEDWDLFLRLAVAGCSMAWVPEPVCQYRAHGKNASSALEARLRAVVSMFDALAQDPRLPADVAGLVPRALAWAFADSARRAVGLGDEGHVRGALRLARAAWESSSSPRERFFPLLEGFESLLEPVLAAQLARPDGAAELSGAAERWGVAPRELRRASARVEMRAFFASVTTGDATAASRHLRRGLSRDLRWSTNRGVVGFLLGRRRRPG